MSRGDSVPESRETIESLGEQDQNDLALAPFVTTTFKKKFSIANELYFFFPAFLSVPAAITRGGWEDAVGFFPLVASTLIWNGMDVIAALLNFPHLYYQAKKSITHPGVKYSIFFSHVVYFSLILPAATLYAFASIIIVAREKDFYKIAFSSNDTIGWPYALSASTYAYSGGLLLQTMTQLYFLVRGFQKLHFDETDGYAFCKTYRDRRTQCEYAEIVDERVANKWSIAVGADALLLSDDIKEIASNMRIKCAHISVHILADFFGFVGALIGGFSMLFDDDTNNKLAKATASFYIASALFRAVYLALQFSKTAREKYQTVFNYAFLPEPAIPNFDSPQDSARSMQSVHNKS